MAKRGGGFIGQDGINAPDQATGVTGTAGDTQVDVSFTPPSDVGASAITGYVATSNDGIGATGSSSPITVSGLTNGSSYTFRVWAINPFGWSGPSEASASVYVPVISTPANAIHMYDNRDIDGYNISTLGNAYDFADRTNGFNYGRCVGNSTRVLLGAAFESNSIEFITWSTGGSASDFGDDAANRHYYGSLSNDTRGIWAGGGSTGGYSIAYSTLASTGDTTDFGDILNSGEFIQAGLSSTTRGVLGGGSSRNPAGMEYITIASTGNSTDFGTLLGSGRKFGYNNGTATSSTRGLFAAGAENSTSNVIEYITIASTGNSTDFGDLTVSDNQGGCSSNKTRAVFTNGQGQKHMCYVTIASTGNATDFGDLTTARSGASGTSNAHGGLS